MQRWRPMAPLRLALLAAFAVAATASDAPELCEVEMNKIKDLLQVSCVAKGLTGVPPKLPKDTGILLLSSNRLARVSTASVQHLAQLSELDLSNSSLAALETRGGALPRLQQLLLSHNALKSLPALQGLPSLWRLALGHNAISQLPEGGFRALGKLQELELQGNRLQSLPPGAFEGLAELKDVDLSDNVLESLPQELLAGLERVEILRLERNRLQNLPGGFFPEDNIFAYVYLAENPWACDCRLEYLRDWINDNEFSVYTRTLVHEQGLQKVVTENDSESVKCHTPDSKQGVPVKRFKAACGAGGTGEGAEGEDDSKNLSVTPGVLPTTARSTPAAPTPAGPTTLGLPVTTPATSLAPSTTAATTSVTQTVASTSPSAPVPTCLSPTVVRSVAHDGSHSRAAEQDSSESEWEVDLDGQESLGNGTASPPQTRQRVSPVRTEWEAGPEATGDQGTRMDTHEVEPAQYPGTGPAVTAQDAGGQASNGETAPSPIERRATCFSPTLPAAHCQCPGLPTTSLPIAHHRRSAGARMGWQASSCCLLRLALHLACLVLVVLQTLAALCALGWICMSWHRPALWGTPGACLARDWQLQNATPRGWQLRSDGVPRPRTYRVCKRFPVPPFRHVSWLLISLPGPTKLGVRQGNVSSYSLDRGRDTIGAVRVKYATASL